MQLEELRKIHPLTVKEIKDVEQINARILMRKFNNQKDFKFYSYLAAHLGGIFDKEALKFKSYVEYDPESGESIPVRIRISDFITEKSIIKSKGMIYLSGFYKSQIQSQIEKLKSDKNGKCQ